MDITNEIAKFKAFSNILDTLWTCTEDFNTDSKFPFPTSAEEINAKKKVSFFSCLNNSSLRFLVPFPFRVSLPTNHSQQSSIRGEADLQLGSKCHTMRHNGENDSIKVSYKTARSTRKIPIISPGLIFVQKAFLIGLF